MVLTQSVLPFKVELVKEEERVTAHGALPLGIEAMRRVIPRAT